MGNKCLSYIYNKVCAEAIGQYPVDLLWGVWFGFKIKA